MRPVTFICALAATLQLLSGIALADGWTWPIRGPVITAYRNGDDPYAAGQHRGVDIAAPVGSRVVAATSGTVTFAGVVGSAGLVVSERTADGRFDLSYLHLSSLSVRRGESVPGGAEVGTVGTSGQRSAEAPHLHFGVRDAGERSAYRDPLDFLAPPPAGGRPEPAPAPVAVGHPAVADPAPVPSSAPSPVPVPVHAPGMPLGGRVPSLVPSGALARGVAPRTALHRHAAGGLLPHELAPPVTPAAGRTGPRLDRPADARSAKIAPAATGPHGEAASPAASRRVTTARPAGHPHHGINIGWLAACIGLVALATVLSHPGGTRKAAARGRVTPARARAAAARGRAALGALLRPAQRGGPIR